MILYKAINITERANPDHIGNPIKKITKKNPFNYAIHSNEYRNIFLLIYLFSKQKLKHIRADFISQ